MMTRRDLLRALSLTALAVGAGSRMTACGSESRPGGAEGVEVLTADVERGRGLPAAVPDAVAAQHALGAGAYGELTGGGDNLALSPYSIAVALAMTQNGARGTTRAEMLSVLDVDDAKRLNGGLNALTRHVESLAGTQEREDGSEAEVALSAANALFGEQTIGFESAFLETLSREYGAGVHRVDFRTAVEDARQAINAWTAGETEDRITELVPEGMLSELTRLVLVNALYLKAPWDSPFEKRETGPGDFHRADGTTVSVPMMTQGTHAALGFGDGWRALRLAYAGRGLAMTVVLPDPGRLDDVEAAVSSGRLPEMIASVRPEQVEITLPRWRFRTAAMLKDMLIALGMPRAFDPERADFSRMTTEAELFISAVAHQTYIAVDEEGTEAAAATAVTLGVTGAPVYVPFTADRPFLFAIHDVEHGTPLFLGRVTDPTA